jgi:hypothetical protein
MTSALDIYTFYLEAADLRSQSHTLTIAAAKVEQIYNPQLKRNVPAIVLTFEKAKKVLKCNKTQAGAMIEITGTDDIEKWPGAKVILTPAPSSNGRQTITITPQPAATEQK